MLLAIIVTIFLSYVFINSSVVGISGHGSPFIHPATKIGSFGKNLSNQRIKLNEKDRMYNIELNIKTIIKMFKQMKKKLAKCEKHKSHTNLIGNQSPYLTFVNESLKRNLTLFEKFNKVSEVLIVRET